MLLIFSSYTPVSYSPSHNFILIIVSSFPSHLLLISSLSSPSSSPLHIHLIYYSFPPQLLLVSSSSPSYLLLVCFLVHPLLLLTWSVSHSTPHYHLFSSLSPRHHLILSSSSHPHLLLSSSSCAHQGCSICSVTTS